MFLSKFMSLAVRSRERINRHSDWKKVEEIYANWIPRKKATTNFCKTPIYGIFYCLNGLCWSRCHVDEQINKTKISLSSSSTFLAGSSIFLDFHNFTHIFVNVIGSAYWWHVNNKKIKNPGKIMRVMAGFESKFLLNRPHRNNCWPT